MGTDYCRFAFKFGKRIGSSAAVLPATFQSDLDILSIILGALKCGEILWENVFLEIWRLKCFLFAISW